MKTTFRVRNAKGNTAYVTCGDHPRYCVIWDWRADRNELEFTLWSPEGRKVHSTYRATLTPDVREELTAATLADIERRAARAAAA